ncbi:Citrate synthase [Candidatus Desulfarcum epimagneticum]|uniref:Citrate synthase n=1 Tax=uncultured Desulfobacteraceae bacterium TaxID=218296 RepID=A0A484HMA8_9BACT|nr:Citrate synthase [uncultured Desulfobacteraceae bacterium]
MDKCEPILNTGLRGFSVATTQISDVDGKRGRLIYRGYPVKDLAGAVSFEETACLLLHEKLPSQSELKDFDTALKKERAVAPEILTAMEKMPADALPMDILQGCVSMLAAFDPDIADESPEAAMRMSMRLIAKMSTLCAAWDRIRNGKKPVDPSPDLGHGANFLYMLTGETPDGHTASFFDTALTLHAEHSFNASTFTARQVASTKAHVYASISAAMGSLSGPLHGGANTRVMKMLMEIGSADRVDDHVKNVLETGGVIMGLGHAVYQVDDPRAHILEPMSRELGEAAGDPKWHTLSKALEKKGKAAFKEKKGKDIFVNVDFYSASLYHYMKIPMDMFTPVFAAARVAGWAAHVLEERFAGASDKPVLYRPESEYIGEYCGEEDCKLPEEN